MSILLVVGNVITPHCAPILEQLEARGVREVTRIETGQFMITTAELRKRYATPEQLEAERILDQKFDLHALTDGEEDTISPQIDEIYIDLTTQHIRSFGTIGAIVLDHRAHQGFDIPNQWLPPTLDRLQETVPSWYVDYEGKLARIPAQE